MGKGDRKTRRGKIRIGSHGKVRPHSDKATTTDKTATAAAAKGKIHKIVTHKK